MARALPFLFVGNHLALDFVNTEIVSAGARVDLLGVDSDFARWARAAGLPLARGATFRTGAVDRRIASLRAALRAVVDAAIDARAPARADLDAVDAALALAPPPPGLAFRAGRLERRPPTLDGVPSLLGHVAAESASFLAAADPARLRRCEGNGCILLFFDVSKSGRRRWCSMSGCGNRAKVAAHYRRARR